MNPSGDRRRRWSAATCAAVAYAVVACGAAARAEGSESSVPGPSTLGPRVLGIDVSAWQGSISQTTWNNLRSIEQREFVFVRASRGGTTGVDTRAGGYPAGSNSDFSLSQRYDDPYFVQNMNRATAAGLFAGSYHFARPDVVATTTNSGGIANSAVDEADHSIQMAGAFMRPGYLLPTFDLETGITLRSNDELARYAIDFSNRIHEVMRIRPMIYLNGNYAHHVLARASAANRHELARPADPTPNLTSPAYTRLWTARYPNESNPDAIDVQTGNPNDGLSWVYGPWDDYGTAQPWTFWQYASTGRLASFNGGRSNLDFNVANGGIEFVKDQLVPAVWWHDASGDWSTLANWNSGQPVTVPVRAPGQLAPIGTQTLPTPRLPGGGGTGPTSGRHDTVILDRPGADITVTLASGMHEIRKFYVRETFLMTGGGLTLNYVPVPDSTPTSMLVSAAVSLSGGARLTAHTIAVDATRTLAAGGDATLTFDTLTLSRGPNPATLALDGNVTIAGLAGRTATIGTTPGTTASGRVDLRGGLRTITVPRSGAAVDLEVSVPVVAGGLVKAGPGTMRLDAVATYADPTIVREGVLAIGGQGGIVASRLVSVDSAATFDVAAVSGGYAVAPGQTLSGSGSVVGSVVVGGGGRLAAGGSAGMLAVTQGLTWASGGILEWQPATGWGEAGGPTARESLAVGGPLAITATPATPFRIELTGLVAGGPTAGFDPALGSSWTLASAAGGITGFAAEKFTLSVAAGGPGDSAPDLRGGSFSVAQAGSEVNLVFTPFSGDLVLDVPTGLVRTQADFGYTQITAAASLTKTGGGTLVLDAANPFTGTVTVADGTLRIARDDAVAGSGVILPAGGTLEIATGVTMQVPSLSLTGGRLDIGRGRVVIAPGGSAEADLRAALIAGRADGSFSGTSGIVTSGGPASETSPAPAIGYRMLPSGEAVVAWAPFGDANLDGLVNSSDITLILAGGKLGTLAADAGWAQGDFNYDGRVNSTDISLLLAAGLLNQPAGGRPATATATVAVPEPGTRLLALLGLLGMLLGPRWFRRSPRAAAR